MLGIRQFLSVYVILGVISSIVPCAYGKGDDGLAVPHTRLNSSQREPNRQNLKREPSAVHSGPESDNSKMGRPTVGGSTPQFGSSNSSSGGGLTTFPSRARRNPSVLESTLSGRIEKWVGNFIPSRETKSEKFKKLPLQTKVYIFKGKIKSDGTPNLNFSQETSKLFSIVNSNTKGEFSVQLPPGEYTIFAEIDGKLYRNSFDGEGFYSTTKIEDGIQTREVITDSRDATF